MGSQQTRTLDQFKRLVTIPVAGCSVRGSNIFSTRFECSFFGELFVQNPEQINHKHFAENLISKMQLKTDATLEALKLQAKTTLETSGKDVKLHSKRV
jgi:hypothetical protein